jgi:voltage-gated potassium channel
MRGYRLLRAATLPRPLIAAAAPVVLILVGTGGYVLIEGWSAWEALYMTVITLTTVGYREVHSMSKAGEAFTMALALGGIFTLFYAATHVIASLVRGDLIHYFGSRRMQHNIDQLNDHAIVCGFGRMGRLVCQQLAAADLPFVTIDQDANLFERFDLPRGFFLHGDATTDEMLKRAGVERARALIAAVASDSDNLYVTMSARLLNEKVFIVARAEDERSEEKLLRAGANRAVSPYTIGGARVAQAVLRPNVVDFLELATRSEHMELNIEEAKVSSGSTLAAKSISDSEFELRKVIVVAIRKPDGKMLFHPPDEVVLNDGDVLIMLGHRTDLDYIARVAANGSRPNT